MTESVAYMSEEGVLFKELPPNPMFELTPLYKRHELTDEEILDTARTMPVIDGATMDAMPRQRTDRVSAIMQMPSLILSNDGSMFKIRLSAPAYRHPRGGFR